MSRRRNLTLDIAPPIFQCTRGLNNFSSYDDSDRDRENPYNQPILWGPEDEVHHDNALIYTMPGPLQWQVNMLSQHLSHLFLRQSRPIIILSRFTK
jgi:hypothetical protein